MSLPNKTDVATRPMGWEAISERHKEKYNRTFVSCHEPYERGYLIDMIIENFPQFRKSKVEKAVGHACKTIATPRGREVFLKCVEEGLNSVG